MHRVQGQVSNNARILRATGNHHVRLQSCHRLFSHVPTMQLQPTAGRFLQSVEESVRSRSPRCGRRGAQRQATDRMPEKIRAHKLKETHNKKAMKGGAGTPNSSECQLLLKTVSSPHTLRLITIGALHTTTRRFCGRRGRGRALRRFRNGTTAARYARFVRFCSRFQHRNRGRACWSAP